AYELSVAVDKDGAGIVQVSFYYQDGEDWVLIGSDSTAPYAVTWDSTVVDDGSVKLKAVAIDAAGNMGETTVDAQVANRYALDLLAGWQLVSTPVLPYDEDIADVFADLVQNGSVEAVVTFVWEDGQLVEKRWVPGSPISELASFADGQGYWVKMRGSDRLVILGSWLPVPQGSAVPVLPSYKVYAGWNLIGFTPGADDELYAVDYLGAVADSVQAMFAYNAEAGYYEPVYWMQPGCGYWLAVSQDGEKCQTYAECLALLEDGQDIDYDGASGDVDLSDVGEPTSGVYDVWEYKDDGTYANIEGVEQIRIEEQRAEREGDLEKAARLRYGETTELQAKLEEENRRLQELQKERKMLKEEVDDEDIAEVVSAWTGIPVSKLLEGEVEKLIHMEERLRRRVVGQEEALEKVSNAIRRARAGLQDPNRPIGSFLFLGPTGVGKTELARALAEFLFDDERAMIRLDMSEYMERHTVARLIGAPPGYVGYEEGGQLTEAVRRRPYSVVLFDEIEKAHQDVFNVLLQILDDGRLTDGQGRTVDFRNTVIIMTSNLGAHIFREYEQPEKVRPLVLQELRTTLRPEFLNRIDEIVIFRPLGRAELDRIVEIQLGHLRRRLAERRIELEVTDAAKAVLAREGYDPTFGARPLKRAIQRLVQDPLAVKILEHQFKEGDTVTVDAEGDQLVFRRAVAAEVVA
ncbi:MAG: AAA family ATPase, partial [Firmicutes bacterium]|nr:AAA family ATPase [Bacillota bacterium]